MAMNKIIKFHKSRKRHNRAKKLTVLVTVIMVTGFSLWGYVIRDMFGEDGGLGRPQEGVPTTERAGDITGYARVTDGDTIRIKGIRIRLYGIDAPEIDQPCWQSNIKYSCGLRSKQYLQNLIRGVSLNCDFLGKDSYGRQLAKCYDSANKDINAQMVSSGNAIAYLFFSRDYARQQAEAKSNKRGIWAGRFTEPYEYRKRNRY